MSRQSIPDRFEYQTSNYPDRVAVKSRKYTFTYDALNRYANRISRAILALRGTKTETVGLMLKNDAPMVAAILGVLKAGKIHVALDPTHPGARAAQILEDAQAGLLITDDENLTSARELAHGTRQVLNIDQIDSSLCEDNLGLSIASEAVAYIIYTSGSTGRPKGVMQNHRNALRRLERYTNNLHISNDDRLTLLSSCSTARALVDVHYALLNGAALYPFDLKEEGFPVFAAWLRQEEITILHTGASIFRYFLRSVGSGEKYPSLRLIWLDGEQLYKKDVELFKLHFSPTCVLVNSLGSTEAGTVRQFVIGKETRINGVVVPVGFPVNDVEVLLLDEAGHPVGFNSPGEITIKSDYLFSGYWRRTELTQQVLLPDPDGGKARIFRTGDMGRMTPDGCLECLGRKDFQVKIRGFRVEVAEVEAALLELGQVSRVAVVANENSVGERYLIAYVEVARTEKAFTAEELRLLLQQKLPEYMLPAQFVFLEALPVTPSGKADLRALPSSEKARSETAKTVLAPRDYIELELARTFTSLLGTRSIGVRDNFFDLGGHSLLAVRLVGEIEKQFGRSFPASITLEAPTIEKLANLVRQQESSTSSLVSLQPAGTKPPLFCVHGVSGDVFIFLDLVRCLGPEQPVYGLQAPTENGQPVRLSVQELAAHYVSKIRSVQPAGPYLLGGYSSGGIIAFEMAQQLLRDGHTVALLALFDTSYPRYWRFLPSHYSDHIWALRTSYHLRQLMWLEGREKLRYIRRVFRGRARIPIGGGLLKIVEYGSQALRHYQPLPYEGQLTLFRALQSQLKPNVERDLGWSRVAMGDMQIYDVPGDHITMFDSAAISSWAEKLKACIHKAVVSSYVGT